MHAYLDAWNEADVDRVCDAYHLPSLVHDSGAVRAQLDAASRRSWLGAYVESTRGALAAGGSWTCPSLSISPLGADDALATARWVFTAGDGTVVEDYLDSYLLSRLDGRWFILADAIHATAPEAGA